MLLGVHDRHLQTDLLGLKLCSESRLMMQRQWLLLLHLRALGLACLQQYTQLEVTL